MLKMNLKIVIPLILVAGIVIGGIVFLLQGKHIQPSPQTYIQKSETQSSRPILSSEESATASSQIEEKETSAASSGTEVLVQSFIQTYFTQELTEEAIQERLEKLKELTTVDFQNEMNIEASSKVALTMLASYKATQVSPSGTTNVNTQKIISSQIFKSEQSDQEYFVQVEYTVTPLGSEESATIKNQVTLDIEDGKISSMSILNH